VGIIFIGEFIKTAKKGSSNAAISTMIKTSGSIIDNILSGNGHSIRP
jgi:hypothetical protein